MKFQVISDIHLEFTGMERELDPVAEVERDVLIVAGDLCERDNGEAWLRRQCEKSPVVFVCGNHEYYGADIDEIDNYYRGLENELNNFYFLQQDVVSFGGVRIAGCTLWTDFSGVDNYEMNLIRRSMSDFNCITKRGAWFTPDVSAGIHHGQKEWLRQQKDIDIVVTHHAPSPQSITDYWKEHGRLLNPAFAANADDLIYELSPAYWIHGHMHSFIRYWHDGEVDGTQVLCNPVGYGGSYQERTGMNDKLLITVEK